MPGVLCCLASQAHRGASLGGVLLCRSAGQAVKGAPWVRSYSIVQCFRSLMSQPLYCSAADAGVLGERLWRWRHPLHMTQQYRLASMASWLSSTGIAHHNLLPHITWIHLSAIIRSLCPGIAPPSLSSSSQLLCLPGYLSPCPGYVWLWQGLSDSYSI